MGLPDAVLRLVADVARDIEAAQSPSMLCDFDGVAIALSLDSGMSLETVRAELRRAMLLPHRDTPTPDTHAHVAEPRRSNVISLH